MLVVHEDFGRQTAFMDVDMVVIAVDDDLGRVMPVIVMVVATAAMDMDVLVVAVHDNLGAIIIVVTVVVVDVDMVIVAVENNLVMRSATSEEGLVGGALGLDLDG